MHETQNNNIKMMRIFFFRIVHMEGQQ